MTDVEKKLVKHVNNKSALNNLNYEKSIMKENLNFHKYVDNK